MRTSPLLAIIILIVLVSKGWACHEEDTNLDGHKPKTGVGIIVSTEIIFAFSSTTTSCDMYTAYLKSNYDQIAENAAVGGGLCASNEGGCSVAQQPACCFQCG